MTLDLELGTHNIAAMKKALRWNIFLRMKNPLFRHFVDKLVLGVNFKMEEYDDEKEK